MPITCQAPCEAWGKAVNKIRSLSMRVYTRVGGQVTFTDDLIMITEPVGEETANPKSSVLLDFPSCYSTAKPKTQSSDTFPSIPQITLIVLSTASTLRNRCCHQTHRNGGFSAMLNPGKISDSTTRVYRNGRRGRN